jgi:hypothetical protein
MALALVREGIWGLSLFAVARDHQSRDRPRAARGGLRPRRRRRGHLILSSESPAAMRRYARLGLEPAALRGRGRDRRPDATARRRRGGRCGLDGSRSPTRSGGPVRRRRHGVDLEIAVDDPGARLLLYEDRAFALVRKDRISLVAGLDDPAATRALNAALAALPPGASASVDFLTSGQDWAVRACLDAGLALSPDGPFFTGGDLGPMRPYIPSGAYL